MGKTSAAAAASPDGASAWDGASAATSLDGASADPLPDGASADPLPDGASADPLPDATPPLPTGTWPSSTNRDPDDFAVEWTPATKPSPLCLAKALACTGSVMR